MKKLPIFFRPEQSCSTASSYSPSAGKPALAVTDWESNANIAPHIELRSFEPVSRDILYAVHDKAYVDAVLDCREDNGFGNRHKGVAASLPYTVGSMLAAAKHVLTNGESGYRLNAAVSPTSGFHHACLSYGGGYCTFNGLMATAAEVQRLGLAKKILILDFDQHYGNGTQNIINQLGTTYVDHITAGKSYHTADQALILASKQLMEREPNHYDLVLFQAGADIHVDDPLGGILTTAEMNIRDREIFTACIMRNTPIVWNLAGGYRRDINGSIEPVLKLHRNTIIECLKQKGAYGTDRTSHPEIQA